MKLPNFSTTFLLLQANHNVNVRLAVTVAAVQSIISRSWFEIGTVLVRYWYGIGPRLVRDWSVVGTRLVRRGAYAKRATRLRQGDELPLFANYTLQNGLFVKNLQIYLHIQKKCSIFVLDFKTSCII